MKISNCYRSLEVDRVHVPRLPEEVRGRVYYARTRDRLDGVARRAPLTGVCTGRVAADVCRVREDLGTTHDRVPRFVPRPNGWSNGGGRRCAAPPLRGGNFSVHCSSIARWKPAAALFFSLYFRTLCSVKGIGGYERERDIKGEESGDQKGRFSWERSWRLAGRTLCYPRLCRWKISRNLELSHHSITLPFSFWANILYLYCICYNELKNIEKISEIDYKSKLFLSLYISRIRDCVSNLPTYRGGWLTTRVRLR